MANFTSFFMYVLVSSVWAAALVAVVRFMQGRINKLVSEIESLKKTVKEERRATLEAKKTAKQAANVQQLIDAQSFGEYAKEAESAFKRLESDYESLRGQANAFYDALKAMRVSPAILQAALDTAKSNTAAPKPQPQGIVSAIKGVVSTMLPQQNSETYVDSQGRTIDPTLVEPDF